MRLRLYSILALWILWIVAAAPAQAVPVFAHRYGLTCQACHTTVPHLTAFGRAFAANGFRLPQAVNGAFPVAVKVNLAYSSDAGTGLSKAIIDEVELLTGGPMGKRFSYFVEQYAVDGGYAGLTRDAFVQYNGEAVHVRVGQFTLPLPVDPEEQRDTEAHYLLFDQSVGKNAFNFFDPRIGLDVWSSWRGFEAHFTPVESYDRQSGISISGADFMASLSKTFANGLSLYTYRYQGQRHLQTLDTFYRDGYGAAQAFGKLNVTGVLQQGDDAHADSGAAASCGAFVEAHYYFSDALTAVARYDRSSDPFSGSRNQTVLTFIMRPRRNMRFTVEDQITDHHTLNLGWLFAY
jgi:hypothetical protein